MQTRTPTWRSLIGLGIFVAVCVGISIGAWLSFGGTVPLQGRGYRVAVELPQANALLPNSDVRIAGVNVGHVVDVSRRGRTGAGATVQIDPEHAPLRRGATSILRTKTLLGEAYLEIAPGDRREAVLADGSTIKVRPGQRNQQRLDEVLDTFAPSSRRDLRAMLAGLDKAFAGRSEDTNRGLARLEPAVVDLRSVLTKLDRQRAQVRQFVASAGDVFTAMGRQSDQIRRIAGHGQSVLSMTAAQSQNLQATVRVLPGFVADLRAASVGLGGASGDLSNAMRSLRPTVPLLRPALASVIANVPAYEAVFNDFTPALRSGAAALPALRRILKSSQEATGPTYMALRQLIPVAKMFTATAPTTVASLANQGAVFNGQAVNETGATQGYVSAWLTAWNEIVGGWTKKLPSHRSNPYPAPNATADIANGGIKSFDCRNTGNAELLPPLGTGTPPCRLQGPWTFDGKQAYYPRLELAKP